MDRVRYRKNLQPRSLAGAGRGREAGEGARVPGDGRARVPSVGPPADPDRGHPGARRGAHQHVARSRDAHGGRGLRAQNKRIRHRAVPERKDLRAVSTRGQRRRHRPQAQEGCDRGLRGLRRRLAAGKARPDEGDPAAPGGDSPDIRPQYPRQQDAARLFTGRTAGPAGLLSGEGAARRQRRLSAGIRVSRVRALHDQRGRRGGAPPLLHRVQQPRHAPEPGVARRGDPFAPRDSSLVRAAELRAFRDPPPHGPKPRDGPPLSRRGQGQGPGARAQ